MTTKLTFLSSHWLLDFSIWTYSFISSSLCQAKLCITAPSFLPCPSLLFCFLNFSISILMATKIILSFPNFSLPPFLPQTASTYHSLLGLWDRHTSFSPPWHCFKTLVELADGLFKSFIFLVTPWSFHPLYNCLSYCSQSVLNSQIPHSASCSPINRNRMTFDTFHNLITIISNL